ncbi:leucine-rich repeat domain-containing protein [Pseudanabaena sp. BC1403]|uniref:leucine-rich repeat domain-containing protein n=1 Tax=Pseudanabaena sp. BC1403 TaxID=2043171 RepID=UPI0015E1913D|nr:leucine-rich repeat domain-containing protein [Pseudanabaena sp. BC1403]
MKSFWCFSIFSVTTLLLSFQVPQAKADQTNHQSFEQWCLQKDSLSIETKYTIKVLLEKSGTQDCKLADKNLNTLPTLDLSGYQISDVNPIAALTNLTKLAIALSAIRDIKPLGNLTKLTELYLGGNQISDIKALASLTNLTSLNLNGNQIRDIAK